MTAATPQFLLYGFAPFGDEPVNPAGAAARALHGHTVRGVTVASVVLPVTWDGAFRLLAAAWDAVTPVAVLGLGQGHEAFAVEWWAHNAAGTRADNDGASLPLREIERGAEARLAVTVNVKRVLGAVMSVAGEVPARASDTAGDFLCNHTLYRALRRAEAAGTPTGFLHVPRLKHCPQDVITGAALAAVRAVLDGINADGGAANA